MPAMTFRQLVDEFYISKEGYVLTEALLEIRGTRKHPGTGLDLKTLRKAYRGERIELESAEAILRWAGVEHRGVEIGLVQLLAAPTVAAARAMRASAQCGSEAT